MSLFRVTPNIDEVTNFLGVRSMRLASPWKKEGVAHEMM